MRNIFVPLQKQNTQIMKKMYATTKLTGAMLLLMLLAFAPNRAMADDDLSSYYYTTEDGTAKQLSSLSGYSFAKVESSTTTFNGNTVYVVTEDVDISDRITCGAGVILVLLDGKTPKFFVSAVKRTASDT